MHCSLLKLLVSCPFAFLGQTADGPTPEQIAWIKHNAVVVKTPVAGNGFDDLQPLKKMIGDARIVALGEGTHGTREFFQMKHRLVEFLAGQMGFTIFSIEANMPEAYRLNDYVLHGKGDPVALIKGMYFWTWDTEEVLAMVEWMRAFNESGKGRIEFTGFDMQTPDVAIKIVTDYLDKVDAHYAGEVAKTYKTAKKATPGKGDNFGVATGTFPIEAARGTKIKLSGFIRTEIVGDGYAGLWWRVDGKSGVLASDKMDGRGATGRTPWKKYDITLDVPKDAININFGVLMPGTGRAWFDDLAVEIDGVKYDPSDQFDFGFEETPINGFYTAGPGYLIKLDNTDPHGGRACLLMECGGKSGDEGEAKIKPSVAAKTCEKVLSHMEKARDDYVKATSEKEADWAIQNARVVVQGMQLRAGELSSMSVRDESMAKNIGWILDHAPEGTKIVLWAHNGHVTKSATILDGAMGSDLETWNPMGFHLKKWYPDEMVVFGFAAGEGEYQAVTRDKGLRRENRLAPPTPDSIEGFFQKSGLPRFILDLRKAEKGSEESGWLRKPRPMRSIGAMAMDEQFGPTNIWKSYDALIYLEHTTAARPIQR